MKQISLIILLLVCTLTGCDPIKMFVVKNKTGEEITLKIIQDKNIYMTIGDTDTLELELESEGDSSEVTFHVGIGKWRKDEVNLLKESVSEIQILSQGETLVYRDKEELSKILPKKKTRVTKQYFENEHKINTLASSLTVG